MEIHVAAKTQGFLDVLETTEAPKNGHVGIRASSPRMVVGPIAQLNCIYTNACKHGQKAREAGSHCAARKL